MYIEDTRAYRSVANVKNHPNSVHTHGTIYLSGKDIRHYSRYIRDLDISIHLHNDYRIRHRMGLTLIVVAVTAVCRLVFINSIETSYELTAYNLILVGSILVSLSIPWTMAIGLAYLTVGILKEVTGSDEISWLSGSIVMEIALVVVATMQVGMLCGALVTIIVLHSWY